MNIKKYVDKYGVYGLNDLLEELLRKVPTEVETTDFNNLVNSIGENLGDLIYALAADTNNLHIVRKKMIEDMVKKMKK